jgi:hypothetical protein
MNPEIENLIAMALADGEVSEKEREIILRKAESFGLDKDEVEMILDGRIALLRNDKKLSQQYNLNNNSKAGVLKKCPACGAPVQAFSANCSDCGHEFRGVEATKSITELLSKLNEIETSIRNTKRNLYERIMDPMGVSSSTNLDNKIAKAKSDIILNFPIPNTKEDLLEILSTALANFQTKPMGTSFVSMIHQLNFGNSNNIIKNAWRVKCEEIIIKSRFSFKNDKKTLDEIEYYAKLLNIK